MLRRFVAGYFGGGWLPELMFLGCLPLLFVAIGSATLTQFEFILLFWLMLLAGILLAGLWNIERGRIALGMRHLAALIPCFLLFGIMTWPAARMIQVRTQISVVESQYSADTPAHIPPRPPQATQIYVDGRLSGYDFQYHVAEQDLRNWLTQKGWTVVEETEKQSNPLRKEVLGSENYGRVTDLATNEERHLESWVVAWTLFGKYTYQGGIQITYDPVNEIAYGHYCGW